MASVSDIYNKIFRAMPLQIPHNMMMAENWLELVGIRRFKQSDWKDYYRICGQPSVLQWAGGDPLESEQEAYRIVRSTIRGYAGGYGTRAAIVIGDDFVGCIALRIAEATPQSSRSCSKKPFKHIKIQLGYWLDERCRGMGIVSGAIKTVLNTLRKLDLADHVVVEAKVKRGNTASKRVLEKNGFKYIPPEFNITWPGGYDTPIDYYEITL